MGSTFKNKVLLFILALSLMVLSGCDTTSDQKSGLLLGGSSSTVPGETATTEESVIQSVNVVSEMRSISAPVSIKDLPSECQKINYLRFGLAGTKGDGSDADMVLVLMTGILVSNNVMSFMGKEMVAMAKKDRGVTLEVWVPDRRYNSLEDLTGVEEMERTGDAHAAIDYYYNKKAINGKTFGGYLTSGKAPYLADMGLSIVMNDVYTLITTLVPDQAVRKQKVFVGGHSLGGFLTAFFAGWDFDGDPKTTNDAGYNNCAGLVGLDTIVSPFINLFDPFMKMLPTGITALIPTLASGGYPLIVQSLKSNLFPRILPLDIIGFTAETYVLLEMLGLQADIRPDEESTLLTDVPFTTNVATLLKLDHSRSLLEFLESKPSIMKYRHTNAALLGTVIDDNFMPIPICKASIGFPSGGKVSKKNFPMPDNLPEIEPLTDLLGILLSGDNLYIEDDTDALYTWKNYDELGAEELAYTTQEQEVSDFHTIAQAMYKGPTNLMEWYFPTRIMVDMLMATYPINSKYGLNYFYDKEMKAMPLFMSIGGNGPFYEPAKNAGIDVSGITAKGYDHFDILSAATDDPNRPNEVFMPLIDFMLKNKK